jgi:transcription antitermination factor NusA-like protein
MMGKKVKVFKYSKDLNQFIRNLLLVDIKDTKVLKNDGKIIVKVKIEKKYRPLLVGREGKNIKTVREFLRRWFNVYDIKLE